MSALPKRIAVLMGGPGSERNVSLATARGVAFVTGHSASGVEPDCAALVRAGMTLVMFMAIARMALDI